MSEILQRKRLTIYHADGTEEVLVSKKSPGAHFCGGITAIGYVLNMPDGSEIIVQPTLHRKVKIETEEVA